MVDGRCVEAHLVKINGTELTPTSVLNFTGGVSGTTTGGETIINITGGGGLSSLSFYNTSVLTGNTSKVDLIPGSGITIAAANNTTSNAVEYTISSSAGGGNLSGSGTAGQIPVFTGTNAVVGSNTSNITINSVNGTISNFTTYQNLPVSGAYLTTLNAGNMSGVALINGTGAGFTALNGANVSANGSQQLIELYNETAQVGVNSLLRVQAGDNVTLVATNSTDGLNLTINAIDTTGAGGGDNVTVNLNSALVGRQPKINPINGTNITWTMANDSTGSQINMTANLAINPIVVGGSGLTLTDFLYVNLTGEPDQELNTTSAPTFENITVSAGAYAADWNGNSTAPTKNDVYDQMELKLNIAGTGAGLTAPSYTNSTGKPNQELNTTSAPTFVNVTVSAGAYAADWNANSTVPTKDAVYDKMETKLDVGGSLITGTNVPADNLTGTVPAASYVAGGHLTGLNLNNTTGTEFKSFSIYNITDAHDVLLWKTPKAITILNATSVCTGGTNVTGSLAECNATGQLCPNSNATWVTAAGTQATSGTMTDSAIDAGDWLYWNTTAVSGTPSNFAVTIYYNT